MNASHWLTPPKIAQQLGVCVDKVHGWIKRGELRAVDVSEQPGHGRPRFRIDPGDLTDFLRGREVVARPKPQRRRRKSSDVIKFY